ncbi:hypothetical protein WICPIJ_006023 [Wickerhamomyces pijperi]|uniref:Uncharacterized protein n=1 Tax=Wickerhamomyces pijperi TaxID=599730 RepID=A0A9P8Q531_WICPI|nr:hypothetical protein WICPIJ_006023 [Wickerhamomyces pijperi]
MKERKSVISENFKLEEAKRVEMSLDSVAESFDNLRWLSFHIQESVDKHIVDQSGDHIFGQDRLGQLDKSEEQVPTSVTGLLVFVVQTDVSVEQAQNVVSQTDFICVGVQEVVMTDNQFEEQGLDERMIYVDNDVGLDGLGEKLLEQ